MRNEFLHNFNLADCSLQQMKLCSFIILAAFKFGVVNLIREIIKLKSMPKCQRIQYVGRRVIFFIAIYLWVPLLYIHELQQDNMTYSVCLKA